MTEVSSDSSVVVLDRLDDLSAHVGAWESLAAASIEPNPFQEPWMVLPAWRAFGRGRPICAVLVYGPGADGGVANQLDGVFVLERASRYRGVPVSTLTTWMHLHCFLGTPLVRAGRGRECLRALFDWLRRDRRGAALLNLKQHASDGPFQRLLAEFAGPTGRPAFVADAYDRAVLRAGESAEAALAAAMSTGSRKELRRQRRRLQELGALEVRTLDAAGDCGAWVTQFLQLEQSGWKGREGSALASDPAQRTYFEQIARTAFDRGRLMLLGLFLDGRPIAMKCNFLARPGAFAFKIAFDESLARLSPGVQLELENVAAFHAQDGLTWMDSCAIENHFMIERLWAGRRGIATTLVATGRHPGAGLLVRSLPAVRAAYRLTRPLRHWLSRDAAGSRRAR